MSNIINKMEDLFGDCSVNWKMTKRLKSLEEIHNAVKQRVFADECVAHLAGLDSQIK